MKAGRSNAGRLLRRGIMHQKKRDVSYHFAARGNKTNEKNSRFPGDTGVFKETAPVLKNYRNSTWSSQRGLTTRHTQKLKKKGQKSRQPKRILQRHSSSRTKWGKKTKGLSGMTASFTLPESKGGGGGTGNLMRSIDGKRALKKTLFTTASVPIAIDRD